MTLYWASRSHTQNLEPKGLTGEQRNKLPAGIEAVVFATTSRSAAEVDAVTRRAGEASQKYWADERGKLHIEYPHKKHLWEKRAGEHVTVYEIEDAETSGFRQVPGMETLYYAITTVSPTYVERVPTKELAARWQREGTVEVHYRSREAEKQPLRG